MIPQPLPQLYFLGLIDASMFWKSPNRLISVDTILLEGEPDTHTHRPHRPATQILEELDIHDSSPSPRVKPSYRALR